jgi:hypothetical protein
MAEISKWTRPQDWGELVVGVLVALSTIVVTSTAAATATFIVLGVLIALDGLISLARPGFVVGEGLEVVLGVLLFLSPFALGYFGLNGASWVAWIGGVLTVLAGVGALPAATSARRAVPH